MPEKTLLTTLFGFESTAATVIAGIDLTGKRAIVTGASSGIGVETARALAGAGAAVTLAVRNLDAGKSTARDIIASTANRQVFAAHLDLADRDSVAAFLGAWDGPLHILVNNAGVMATPELRTPDGWELQVATNHLGHFALATGLHDALVAAGNARVVSVSSAGHRFSPVVFQDIHSRSARMTRGWPTASPRQRISCLPSRRPSAGRATARDWRASGQDRHYLLAEGDRIDCRVAIQLRLDGVIECTQPGRLHEPACKHARDILEVLTESPLDLR